MDPNNNNSNSNSNTPNVTPPSSQRSTPDSNIASTSSQRSTPNSSSRNSSDGGNNKPKDSYSSYITGILFLTYLIGTVTIFSLYKNDIKKFLTTYLTFCIICAIIGGFLSPWYFVIISFVSSMVMAVAYNNIKSMLGISIIFAIISILLYIYKKFLASETKPLDLNFLNFINLKNFSDNFSQNMKKQEDKAQKAADTAARDAAFGITPDILNASNKILWLLGLFVLTIIVSILIFAYYPFNAGSNKLYAIMSFAILFFIIIGALIEIYRTHPGPRTPSIYTSYLATMFEGLSPLWWIPFLIFFFVVMTIIFIKNPVKNNASLYGIGGSVLAIIIFTIIGSRLFIDTSNPDASKASYLSAFLILAALIAFLAIIMFSIYKFNTEDIKYYTIIGAVLLLAIIVGFIIYLMRDNTSNSSTSSTNKSVFDYIKSFLSGWNQWWIMLLTGIIALVLAFVTYFSPSDISNNTKFFTIGGLILFTCITFFKALKLWSSNTIEFGGIIKKLTILLAFIMLIISVYKFYIKPNIKDINTISGSIILLVVFFVILFISLMGYFNIAIKNPDILGDNNTNKGFVGSMFSKMGYIIGAFFLLSVIFLLFNWLGSYVLGSSSDSETSKTTNIIVQIIISIIGLGILYKVLMRFDWFKRFLDKPIFGLLLNILFYIPCLLTNAYQSLLNEYNLADKTVISLIIIELLIIVAYFFAPQLIKKQYMKNGKQLLNEPIKLSSSKTVGELDELYDVTKGDSSTADQINYDYTYGLSFWTFIDSNPPSTNASFNSAANILSFSNNPAIKYNPTTNTLFITTKSDSDSTISIANNVTNLEKNATNTNKVKEIINNAKNMPINIELDENNDRIIYKDTNFLLQKWNNIVINYHGGTLDVFINGQLVKSSIEVAPYMAFNKITLGQENGLSGGIANVAFFKKPLDILTINTIYTSLKSMDPPVVK
jgi:hypothetical protein